MYGLHEGPGSHRVNKPPVCFYVRSAAYYCVTNVCTYVCTHVGTVRSSRTAWSFVTMSEQ